MSKLEKIINSKNNSFVLSNLKFNKANLNSKSTSNKSNKNFKIKYSSKTKDKNNPIKLSKIIIDFFLNLNEMDNSIENIRVKLYSSSNFIAQNLFDYLDRNSKKFLALNDFKFFLRDNQISFSEKNLRKLIHNFDKNNDFSINYDEFLGIIYPKKNKPVSNAHSEEDGLEIGAKKLFCELICAELNFVEKCFELAENVRNKKEFTAYEAFKEIVGDEKYININNLKNFFNNKEVKLNDDEMNQLMFRIDKDNDGLISYEDFKDIFSPLSCNIDLISDNTKRIYNKDNFYQYDNDDENDDIQSDVKNINNIINDKSNSKNNSDYNVSVKKEKNIDLDDNKENDKNIMNINKAEERYNFDMETNLENNKSTKDPNNIISKTEIENITPNSINIYKEDINSTNTEIDNNKKEYDRNSYLPKNKSINNYNYYSRSLSNNNLLEHTKSILGIGHNNIMNKLKVTSNINYSKVNINQKKNKKKIIEIEYENDCNMKTSIRNDENKNIYQNEKINDNNSEIISDSLLNFDYSRYTNKDRHNGSYYFKQRNKGEIAESNNNSTNNISHISDEENNNDNSNKNKNKDIIMRNNNKNIQIKNTNKKNSFSLEYNYNNLFSFKDEINFKEKIRDKSYNKKTNKSNFENSNHTFDEENVNQKNILNFNYTKENKTDIINNSSSFNDTNYKTENKNIQKYLDSLENINPENMEEPSMKIKPNMKQYHYNIKLTRNFTRNNIQSQINNKAKSKNNNYILRDSKNINIYNNNRNCQNKSCVMPTFKAETDLFNNEFENMNMNIYNNKPQNIYNNCESNKCNCKCKKSKNNDINDYEQNRNDNDIFIYNNLNNNMNNINNGRKNTKNRKSSSLPKNYFTYKNNNLYMDYSKDFEQNNNNNNPNILQRNNDINKINFYHTNRIAYKNVYRNPPRNNNNNYPNLNRSYYFLESSSKNNNFKIDQLDNKIPIPKNNINNNKKRINMNNNNINKSKNKNNNNIINSNKFGSLNNLFLDFIKQDNAIESMRQILSGREDSNLMDLFSLFDHKGNKLIYASDFIKSLKEFGLYINMEDIKYIYRKFNKKINESFDFDEFCEIILPKKYSNEKIMGSGNWTNLSKNKNYYRGISIETKKMLGALFKNIIDGEKSNEKFRRILAENNELSGNDLFNKIKKNYSVGIYKEDIANFMKKNKYKLNNNEIELLMDRFDKNKNGMIDYKEFIIEISPMNKQ